MNQTEGIASWFSFGLSFLALLAATLLGIWQLKINARLVGIQTSAAIFAFPVGNTDNPDTVILRLINVGGCTLYLEEYSVDDITVKINSAIIPANQQGQAWYTLGFQHLEGKDRVLRMKVTDDRQAPWSTTVDFIWSSGQWRIDSHKLSKAK